MNSFEKIGNNSVSGGIHFISASFFAQGRAYVELRRIEQLGEAGTIDAIPATVILKPHLPIAGALGSRREPEYSD